ncbi:MAG TPA: hypothetical protein VLM38_07970 [Blastocatellia bacterium]|nr:hypothetical protein [Blastocatellia bacterium]
MAGLQARSPLRSAHPLFFVNKIVSLTAFILLLGAGWVALSYLKNDVFDGWRTGASQNTPAVKSSSVEQAAVPEVKLLVPARLVYSCAADKDYYHASTHLPIRCERIVLSEEAALGRGLKRCKRCFPD